MSIEIPIVRQARLRLLTQLTSVNSALSFGNLQRQLGILGVIATMPLYRRANAHRSPNHVTDAIESPRRVPRHL